MLVVGLDDTDSRETGMCTTYVGAVLGERLRQAGYEVDRHLLVRCNPAVEHKTRGNAAVAVHVRLGAGRSRDEAAHGRPVDAGDAERNSSDDVDAATSIARETIAEFAETDDPRTNPGLVVAPGLGREPESIPEPVRAFARQAVSGHHEIQDAIDLAEQMGYCTAHWGDGRGRIGALAAVGAWAATEEWTYERIAYRDRERWGTERDVDADSVVAAADDYYPAVWDTVDRTAGEIVCVPHTPGPVLFGIRGDDAAAVADVAEAIEAEPVERAVTFVTNQGTDAHLQSPPDRDPTEPLADGRSYCIDGVVDGAPETRAGGHVFFDVRRTSSDRGAGETGHGGAHTLDCVAFEPTKRFRDSVRSLRAGDRVTVCGELSDGTLKLEKFAVRDAVRTEAVTPTCPSCERRMESAGADQGYRCRDCGTSAPGLEERHLDRALDVGWYEVPPLARRHVAKPLVRGGFDGPTHPER